LFSATKGSIPSSIHLENEKGNQEGPKMLMEEAKIW
jgi:hypothetical protein